MLTWKPAQWEWTDLADCVAAIEAGHEVAMDWSTGRRKAMVIGDNVYLLRQGTDPIGIFGQGVVTSLPLLRESYTDKNKDEYRVEIRIKTLLYPATTLPLDISTLGHPLDKLWNSRETGDRVPPAGSEKLRDLWKSYWPLRQAHGQTIATPKAPHSRAKLLKIIEATAAGRR